jgi:acyl transferase domain-containing protein
MDLSTDVKDLALGISAPTQGLASASRLAFVFTGQGAQWFGMGSELLVCPIFRDSINASQTYLAEMGWSLSLESTYGKSCLLWPIDQILGRSSYR